LGDYKAGQNIAGLFCLSVVRFIPQEIEWYIVTMAKVRQRTAKLDIWMNALAWRVMSKRSRRCRTFISICIRIS